MPMISPIGRKQLRVRVLVWGIYLALTIGSLTMLYPFLLMLGGSTKSAVDTPEAEIVPSYLVSDEALYRKHMEGLFNESSSALQNAYGLHDAVFSRLSLPEETSPLLAEWRAFLENEEPDSAWFVLGYLQCPHSRNVVPLNLARLRAELLEENGSIGSINLKYGTSFPTASAFMVIPPNFLNRFVDYPDTAFLKRVESFCLAQPTKWRAYLSLTNQFRSYLQIRHGKNIADFNSAKGTAYAGWNDLPVGNSISTCPPEYRDDFVEFLRLIVNPAFVRIRQEATPTFHAYLEQKYQENIAVYNTRTGSQYPNFSSIPASEKLPASGIQKSDWKSFLEGWRESDRGTIFSAPAESLYLVGPDFAFRQFLQNKYGTITVMNERLGTRYSAWELVSMPQRETQYEDFTEMKGWLRWQFTIRNYIAVWDFLVVNGRGLINTIIFCALSVLAALTVDPIAAYALSRFKPRSTYKVLLFLMMTMAFPAMVTQIPMFLLLRDLGLLNTFWALVLPDLANGYHIFLLKGFFDSLPRELYESAEIDGASEVAIFLNITMALSKPILAVIALGAFTSAYAAFMFALLLCQDPKMWTLMVWLYQLQQTSGQGIIFASLLIAAIPTLLVFIACQNVIMRGIVVPVEK